MLDRDDLGRLAYALTAIFLGVIGLWWRDFAGVWQPLDNLGVEFNRSVVATVYAFAFLAAGVATAWRPSAGPALIVLAVLHGLAALGWIPRVVAHGAWTGLFEMLSLTIAAVVGYARLTITATWAKRTVAIGRIAFAICLLVFGLSHFFHIDETAGMVPAWLAPGQKFWAYVTGALYVLAGIATLLNRRATLAVYLTVAMMIGIDALVWVPMLLDKPGHFTLAGNVITLAMAAAAWVVADALRTQQRFEHLHPRPKTPEAA